MEAGRIICLLLWIGIETAKAGTLGGYSRWRPIPGSSAAAILETSAVYDDATCGSSGGFGSWTTCTGCANPWSSTAGTCIQMNSDQSWSIKYTQENYDLLESTATPRLSHQEVVGLALLTRVLSTEVDTRLRSDTGQVNSPPITVLRPVITVNSGCSRNIPISVHDEDGDKIQCRFTTTTTDCGDFCTDSSSAFITLNESTCVISYNGGTTIDDVVVSMFIEDFPQAEITVGSTTVPTTTRLSRVSLQFVIRIGGALTDCTAVPVLSNLDGGDAVVINTGAVFSQSVVASASGATISKITAFGLNTVTSSTVALVPGGGDLHSATFTWTADSVYSGDNSVCFTAELADGVESEQKCKTIRVEEPTAATSAAVTTAATSAAVTTAVVETTAEVNPCLTANGGCSDMCSWTSGTTVTCSCHNPCWHLARDGKNCIPEVQLSCTGGEAQISIEKCANSGVISVNGFDPISSPDSIPSTCRPSENTTHTSFQYALNLCGSSVIESSTAIEYNNTVRFWPNNTDPSVTRGTGFAVYVVCSFPKYNNLTSAFKPLDSSIDFLAVPGLGFFTFDFKFYTDASFAAVHVTDPVRYQLNSDIYFAIEATGGSGVELFTETCIAEPATDVVEGVAVERYTMIENGCMKDYTMSSYVSSDPMHNRFSVKAFRFVDSLPDITNDTNVAIKCYVVVCVIDSTTTTRCTRGCVTSSTRRRRDATYEERVKRQASSINQTVEQEVFESSAHLVASVDVQVETDKNENLVDWRWILLIIAATLGAVLVLLACCRCCWIYPLGKRRRRKRKEDEEEKEDSGIDNGAFKVPNWCQIPVDH